jgi:hypothetical protein
MGFKRNTFLIKCKNIIIKLNLGGIEMMKIITLKEFEKDKVLNKVWHLKAF